MNSLPSPLQPSHRASPHASPPGGDRVAIAVALAPILLLLALTLVVAGLIELDTGLAVALACSVWLGSELHHYQKAMEQADEADQADPAMAVRTR